MVYFQLGDFSQVEPAYVMELSKIVHTDLMKQHDYYAKLFSYLGNFFLNLGLLEAAKKIFSSLIKHLEKEYKESNGTVVYNAFNQSCRYRCKHPEVLQVGVTFHIQLTLLVLSADNLCKKF